MTKLKVKVCGMKVPSNIEEVASLGVDYVGFIFSKESKRFVGRDFDPVHLNLLHPPTKATGVFVNEYLPNVLDKIDFYHFDAVQLHGEETPEYCKKLRAAHDDIEIIKAFSITPDFDFEKLKTYAPHVNYFLFDAKGTERGGNGEHFDWEILSRYTLNLSFFLSGGIGLADAQTLAELAQKTPRLVGVDINSRFEKEPGVKDAHGISDFVRALPQ